MALPAQLLLRDEQYTVPLGRNYEGLADGQRKALFIDPNDPTEFRLYQSGATARSHGVRLMLVGATTLMIYGLRLRFRRPATPTPAHEARAVSGDDVHLRIPMALRVLGAAWLISVPVAAGALLLTGGSNVLGFVIVVGLLGVWPALHCILARVDTDNVGIVIADGWTHRRRYSWNEILSFQAHHGDPFGEGASDHKVWLFLSDYDPQHPYRTARRGTDHLGVAWDCLPNSLEWQKQGRRRIPHPPEVCRRLEEIRTSRSDSSS